MLKNLFLKTCSFSLGRAAVSKSLSKTKNKCFSILGTRSFYNSQLSYFSSLNSVTVNVYDESTSEMLSYLRDFVKRMDKTNIRDVLQAFQIYVQKFIELKNEKDIKYSLKKRISDEIDSMSAKELTIVAAGLNTLQDLDGLMMKAIEAKFFDLIAENQIDEYQFCVIFISLSNIPIEYNSFEKIKKHTSLNLEKMNAEHLSYLLTAFSRQRAIGNNFDSSLWKKINQKLIPTLKNISASNLVSICNSQAIVMTEVKDQQFWNDAEKVILNKFLSFSTEQISQLLYSYSVAGNKGSDEIWRMFGIYFNNLDYNNSGTQELSKIILSFGIVNRGSNSFWAILEKALLKKKDSLNNILEIVACLHGFSSSKAGSGAVWEMLKEKLELNSNEILVELIFDCIAQCYKSGRRHSMEIFDFFIKRFCELYPTLPLNFKIHMYKLLKEIGYLPKEILNVFSDIKDIDNYQSADTNREFKYNERIKKNSQYVFDKFLV